MQTYTLPNSVGKPPIPYIDLPDRRAREAFDLQKPLPVDLDTLPLRWRKLAEQAERFKRRYPNIVNQRIPLEYRFPELYAADEQAHQFYTTEKRVPLPNDWPKYGRSFNQWQARGYNVESPRFPEQPQIKKPQPQVQWSQTSPGRAAIISANPLIDYCRARGFNSRRKVRVGFALPSSSTRRKTASFKIGPDPRYGIATAVNAEEA